MDAESGYTDYQETLPIDMPLRTVGEYLKRWGFTPQKPLKRAYEQNPEAVKKWLDEEYPKIASKAKKKGLRFIGGTKQVSAIPASMAAVTHREARRR